MRWAFGVVLAFLSGFLVTQINFPRPQGTTVKATVIRVIDGDTISVRVEDETKPVTVRIIGYDAPEKDQPFGETATKFLRALLEGREIILESDAQALDRYGRRLYHVWVSPTLVSELMLLSGLGAQMTIPPNVRHAEWLSRAQRLGREIGLGIWARGGEKSE